MNNVIEVPDIAVVKTIDGVKKLMSLRDQKVKQENALHDFQAGSGVKYNGDLYVLDGGMLPIVRMTSTATSVSCDVTKSGDIDVDWGDGTHETNVFTHTYTDGAEEHEIVFYGKKDTLTYFSCYDGQLTALDVSKNTELSTLGCIDNKLTSLDVSKNIKLKKLYCYYNKLTSLDVSQNVELTLIDCSNNQLTALDVSQNVALTELNCSSNQLTSLNVAQNVALTELFCRNNKLTALDVSQNVGLTVLSCSWNPFVTNQSALTSLAESLPQREISDNAKLNIGNQTSASWIQSICDAKNWTIE